MEFCVTNFSYSFARSQVSQTVLFETFWTLKLCLSYHLRWKIPSLRQNQFLILLRRPHHYCRIPYRGFQCFHWKFCSISHPSGDLLRKIVNVGFTNLRFKETRQRLFLWRWKTCSLTNRARVRIKFGSIEKGRYRSFN